MSVSEWAAALLGSKTWTVIEGDSMALLGDAQDGAVDHVITDPPYDEKTHRCLMEAFNSGRASPYSQASRPSVHETTFEHLSDVNALTTRQLKMARRWVLNFCTLEMIGEYKDAAGDLWVRAGFWYAPDRAPQFSGDRPAQAGDGVAIMHRGGRKRWNGGGHRAFWSFGIEHSDRVHPTQKPVALMLKIIEQFTDPGDVVLDPFCGSGTTGVACVRLGRRFIGVERLPKYAAIARERLAAESGGGLSLMAARAGQGALFGVS